jgi:hypothetical protein
MPQIVVKMMSARWRLRENTVGTIYARFGEYSPEQYRLASLGDREQIVVHIQLPAQQLESKVA